MSISKAAGMLLMFGLCIVATLAGCRLGRIGTRAVELPTQHIRIDLSSPGLRFDGLGGQSAGASSRLLIDYPEPQRSQILDYLFKPGYGAGLQHLKVDLGADINSTDGVEPGHAHTREEFNKPRREFFERGYEWWLMKEARKRNPEIILSTTQCGAPAWIGPDIGFSSQAPLNPERKQANRKKFYSQDNANYLVAFVNGAKDYHGLEINYVGLWNETTPDPEWIKLLRRTLDEAGLKQVRIIAADLPGRQPWVIAEDMLKDKALMDAVAVVGAHYPGQPRKGMDIVYDSTAAARQTGKPLWSSEEGPWRGDWEGAVNIARSNNRNYIRGQITSAIYWSLITSYYDNLPIPGSGIMRANTPWSGHYEVQPVLWCVAHWTRFTEIGWRYNDGACGLLQEGKGSYTTLVSPDRKDWTMVIETCGQPEGPAQGKMAAGEVEGPAKKKAGALTTNGPAGAFAPQNISIAVPEKLAGHRVWLWTSDEKRQFVQGPELKAENGSLSLPLEPGRIYTITTRATGDVARPSSPIPANTPFALPYQDDFESCEPFQMARYFADQGGVFEVMPRGDGQGQCLRQVIPTKGVEWNGHPTPEPYTMMGSTAWDNYEVSCDMLGEAQGHVALYGRLVRSSNKAIPPDAYWLKLNANGSWELNHSMDTLTSGSGTFAPQTWHNLKLLFSGPTIAASIDGREVARLEDFGSGGGMAGIGCGWQRAQFDNFRVSPLAGPQTVNLAKGRPASASSVWDIQFPAGNVTDGDAATRWNSAKDTGKGEWLEVDLGAPVMVGRTVIRQLGPRILKYRIQVFTEGHWLDAVSGTASKSDVLADYFAPSSATKIRLMIDGVRGGKTPTITEFEVYP